MLELKIKNRTIFVIGVLLMQVSTLFYSFGGSTAITPLLVSLGGYDYYAMVSAIGSAGTLIILPAAGAIGNKIGDRNAFYLGWGLMLIGCVLIQFCNNIFLLMLFHAIGSIGAGFLMSAPYLMVGSVFEPTAAMKYYGLISTATGVGSLLGPIVAGICTDAGLNRLAFLLWVPVAIIAFVIITAAYPNVKREGIRFDFAGLLNLAVIIICFVLWTGLSGNMLAWVGPGMILPVVVVVGAIVLAKHSNKIDNPAVPLRIFKYKRFRVSFFTNILGTNFPAVIVGCVLVYTMYTMNQSATVASTGSMPYTLINTFAGLVVGQIMAKNFIKNVRRLEIVAAVCALASMGLLVTLQPTSSMVIIWIAAALAGVTASATQTCLTPYFQFGLPQSEFGAAQGMYMFASTGGSTIFIAIVGVLVNLMGGNIKVVFVAGLVVAVLHFLLIVAKLKITPEEAAAVAASVQREQ